MDRFLVQVLSSLVASVFVLALAVSSLRAQTLPAQREIPYIETHIHLKADYREQGRVVWDFEAATREALQVMDRLQIALGLLMPPPFAPDNPTLYDYRKLREVCERHPQRFAFLGGGDSLNPLLQQAVQSGLTAEIKKEFRQRAEQIAADGAAGFGELTALHFSFRAGHSFEAAPPDHELFLLLADIAAAHELPIDLHMEAVSRESLLPEKFRSPPNPPRLAENISGLERLLRHNRKARLVWAHTGWDNTGQATVSLYARLLAAHPNLYLQLKVYRDSHPETMILADGKLKPEWLKLIEAHPERFVLGSDNFFGIPGKTRPFPDSSQGSRQILRNLPPQLARKIAAENALRIYRLPGAVRK